MRVITPAKLGELKAEVEALAMALGQGTNRWGDDQAVAEQLAYHGLTGDRIIGTYSVVARRPQ